MLLATARWPLLLAVLLALNISCGRGTPPAAMVSASVAYADGFEVVVFELRGSSPTNVRSLPLKEAEQAIAAGSQVLVSGNAAALQQQLSAGRKGDSQVFVSVQQLGGGKEQVRVAFHGSNRTFIYEYIVAGAQVIPVGSEYRDLAKSNVVQYTRQ